MRVRVRGAADLAEGDGRADYLLRAVLQQTAHRLQQLHRGRQHRLTRAVRVHLVRASLGLVRVHLVRASLGLVRVHLVRASLGLVRVHLVRASLGLGFRSGLGLGLRLGLGSG